MYIITTLKDIIVIIAALIVLSSLRNYIKLLFKKNKVKRSEKFNVTVFLPNGQVREYRSDIIKDIELGDRYISIMFNNDTEIEFERVTCIVETIFDSGLNDTPAK